MSGHSEAVTFLNFRSEGYLLASGDKSGKTLIWDTETYELEKVLYEHDDKIIDIAFSNFGYFC